jgi:hypothetical protein
MLHLSALGSRKEEFFLRPKQVRETFYLVAKACAKHDVRFEQDNPICSVVSTNAFPSEPVNCLSMSVLERNMSILEITEIIITDRKLLG